MKSEIFHKLNDYFRPSHLEIINESSLHSGHKHSPNNGNSHFFVEIRADRLIKLSRVEGQKLIYEVLRDEMKTKIHALRIKILY